MVNYLSIDLESWTYPNLLNTPLFPVQSANDSTTGT